MNKYVMQLRDNTSDQVYHLLLDITSNLDWWTSDHRSSKDFMFIKVESIPTIKPTSLPPSSSSSSPSSSSFSSSSLSSASSQLWSFLFFNRGVFVFQPRSFCFSTAEFFIFNRGVFYLFCSYCCILLLVLFVLAALMLLCWGWGC